MYIVAIIVMDIYLYVALIRGRLLFPLTHDPCGEYSRVATIESAAFIQGNTILCIE